ncbi:MAG: class I SAM-dependent methyltransferase [Candidatus Omnitrophica bacterium]|nr:class I SAM-dependent methyltransferase [Candidatus Omnitrophota bacterium]
MDSQDLSLIYKTRFKKESSKNRDKMFSLLCSDFLQRYVSPDSTVLDVAAGRCGFINNIKAKRKIALDINADMKSFAGEDVEVVISDARRMPELAGESVDVVFASNFFEHIGREDIIKVLKELFRILKKDGKLLLIQPNIRFCCRDYWMFFDHLTALDDRGFSEALSITGFYIAESRPRFLPFSTKNRLPKTPVMLKLYLKSRILQHIFGKQMFIYAKKLPRYL